MELSIRDILNVAFRYSRTLLIFWAVVVGATLVFYFQSRWAYESTAKILISLGPEAQGRAEYLNGKNLQLLQREQQIHDEQQILQSHEVLLTTAKWITGDPVAGSPPPIDDWRLKEAQRYFTGQQPEPTLLLRAVKIATSTLGRFGKPETHAEQLEDMVEEISKALSVNAIFDSDALDVKFRYRDPRVAQTVLRLLIAAYINHHIEVFQTSAESDLVKAQFDQVVGQYHNRLAEFSSFMKTHRVYNDQSQMNALIEEREKLQQGLNNAQADSDAEDARLATLKSIDQSLQRFEQYSTTEVRNKQREELSSKLNNTLLEEQVLLSHHPQGSRAYKEEQLKLDELRRLVAQEPAQVVDQTEQRRSKASELAESEIISATEAQKGDQARFDRLHQDLRNTDSEIAGYVGDLQQFNSLKLELDLAKQESEQMAQVYANSRLKTLTSQNAITDVSVIDAPTWDWHPASPKKKVVMFAASGLLLLGSIAIPFACAVFDPAVADGRTAEQHLGAPVAGVFSTLQDNSDESEFSELFTRENYPEFARIFHSLPKDGPEGKVILLATSTAGEGASLVALGLSRFLSRVACEKTAFVDCTEHSMIGGSADSEGAESGPSHLALPNENASGSGTINGLHPASALSKLRNEYRYIVIAGGAIKHATNLLAIGGVVSATFLLVEAGKTRKRAARQSLETLRRYGFQEVRLLLNKRDFYIPDWLMRFV